MRSRKERRLDKTLADLADLLAEADELVERAGSWEGYTSDSMLMLAGEAIVVRLGEVVKRLPTTFLAAHPDVPWKSMVGTRTIVAHEYDRVDHRIIWTGLSEGLPAAAALVRHTLPAPKPLLTVPGYVILAPPAQRRTIARNEVCGKWMPVARTFCALPPGHRGHCRSSG